MMFRTGVTRVLSHEADFEVVAQCADALRLRETLNKLRNVIVILPTSLDENLLELAAEIHKRGSRVVLVVEHGTVVQASVAEGMNAIVPRSVAGATLVDTLHRVVMGERVVQWENVQTEYSEDGVGQRVLQRLTPKEIQIIALVTEGWKNREIAGRLNTKEQVVKNYLRSIYDKTGVSDRLELALFTIHHRALADATGHAWESLEKKLA
jgi:DNA-binding NarL/FixJ family response regulator